LVFVLCFLFFCVGGKKGGKGGGGGLFVFFWGGVGGGGGGGGGGGSRGQDSSSEDALIWSVHFTLLSSRVLLIPNKPASCGVTLVFGKHYMFGFVR